MPNHLPSDGHAGVTSVRFFFDPVCPWTWITSRWLVEVAEQRSIHITWETFSLRYRNRDNPAYDWLRDEMEAQYPCVRIIQATRQRFGNEAVGRLYTTLGTLIHHDRDDNLTRLHTAVAAAGLPDDMMLEGTNPAWDESVVASTDEAWQMVGDDAGIPLIVIPDSAAVLFGPVLSPAPTGPDALDLWDAFATLRRFGGLYEIKRTRNVRPILGPRPA